MNKDDFPEVYRFLAIYQQKQAKQYKEYMQTNTRRGTITSKIHSQLSGEMAIKAQKCIVGSLDTLGNLSFAANPVLHDSTSQARAECKRLAALSPGKTYLYTVLAGAERVVPSPTTVSI